MGSNDYWKGLFESSRDWRLYPYNLPMLYGRFATLDRVSYPAGDISEGWTNWAEQAPPGDDILLQITYDFHNYPWHTTVDALSGQFSGSHYANGEYYWRLTGIGKEQLQARTQAS